MDFVRVNQNGEERGELCLRFLSLQTVKPLCSIHSVQLGPNDGDILSLSIINNKLLVNAQDTLNRDYYHLIKVLVSMVIILYMQGCHWGVMR